MSNKKNQRAVPDATKERFPLGAPAEEVVYWLADNVRVSASTSLFGRATIPKQESELIAAQVKRQLGECRVTSIPKSTASVYIQIGQAGIKSLEEQGSAVVYKFDKTRFWRSLCESTTKRFESREEMKAERERLLKLKGGENPGCEECGTKDKLEFQRPDEAQKGDAYVTTLLLTKRRWPEAEAMALESRILCSQCHGRKKAKNDEN